MCTRLDSKCQRTPPCTPTPPCNFFKKHSASMPKSCREPQAATLTGLKHSGACEKTATWKQRGGRGEDKNTWKTDTTRRKSTRKKRDAVFCSKQRFSKGNETLLKSSCCSLFFHSFNAAVALYYYGICLLHCMHGQAVFSLSIFIVTRVWSFCYTASAQGTGAKLTHKAYAISQLEN